MEGQPLPNQRIKPQDMDLERGHKKSERRILKEKGIKSL